MLSNDQLRSMWNRAVRVTMASPVQVEELKLARDVIELINHVNDLTISLKVARDGQNTLSNVAVDRIIELEDQLERPADTV